MAEPIPPDEEITKTQLWGRIDHLRDVFESHKGEILYQLGVIKEVLRNEVSHINSEHDLSIQKRGMALNESINSLSSNLLKKTEEAIKEIELMFDNHIQEVEERIKQVREYIDSAVKTEAMQLFSDDQKEVSEMKKGWIEFSKSVNEGITRYMTETRSKVGELNLKVEKVISKLKDGFQDL